MLFVTLLIELLMHFICSPSKFVLIFVVFEILCVVPSVVSAEFPVTDV